MDVFALGLLGIALGVGSVGCRSGSGPSVTPTPTPNPRPAISTISPNGAAAGALARTLTVLGSNFVSASKVQWSGSERTTTFVSSNELQAQIAAADLSTPGKFTITVFTPTPGGGTSNAGSFTVAPDTVAFDSARALDGSDALSNFNIWTMNPDGSGASALTRLTAFSAFSFTPMWSPDGSKIGFESSRALDGSNASNLNFAYNIWVMNADGSGATPLTKLTNASSSLGVLPPVWSPDSSKIVFFSSGALDGSNASNANFTSNIWVMNPDGSGANPLTKLTAANASSAFPVWSPDGSKIAFSSLAALDGSDASNGFTFNIWAMNADGSGTTPLTKLTAANAGSSSPAWSPDGGKIAFSSSRALDGSNAANTNSTSNIWVMNADGSRATPLTKLTAVSASSPGLAFGPVWSPDGDKILFGSARALDGSDAANTNSTSNIWMMNPDGSGATPLTRLTAVNAGSFAPVWSPDGSKILFTSQRALNGSDAPNTNSTSNIWTMNADGSGATPLTKLTAAGASSGLPNQP